MEYLTNDHGYVLLVVNTSRSFPNSWLITGFVTRSTRRVPLVEQELLTHPEHMSSPSVCCGVRVTRSLVLYECFVDRCLSFCTFFFWPLYCLFSDIRILITPFVSSNSSFNAILFLHCNVQISPFSCHQQCAFHIIVIATKKERQLNRWATRSPQQIGGEFEPKQNVIIGEIVNHNCGFCHLSFKSNGFVILHIRGTHYSHHRRVFYSTLE